MNMKTFMSENSVWVRQIVLMAMIIFLAVPVFAQKERKYIREGNRFFDQGLQDTTSLDTVNFSKAEVAYRRALQEKPDNFKWKFNLADAMYKQAKPAKAAEEFQQLINETNNSQDKAKVYHNLGNSLLAQKKIDESIDAYKKSLRLNPNDMATKYNLAYAEKLKQQQKNKKKNQKNQQNKNNKDKNNKNNQDKNKQNKDQNKQNQDKNKQNQDQKKNQDQNKQNQNKQNQNNQNQNQQQQQPQQNKISKQNAEQMLQALQNDEQKTQEKVRKLKAKKAQEYKVEKDW
jgi:tetratricopeptide (TPR) repeat protein